MKHNTTQQFSKILEGLKNWCDEIAYRLTNQWPGEDFAPRVKGTPYYKLKKESHITEEFLEKLKTKPADAELDLDSVFLSDGTTTLRSWLKLEFEEKPKEPSWTRQKGQHSSSEFAYRHQDLLKRWDKDLEPKLKDLRNSYYLAISKKTARIFHISDIHFGKRHRYLDERWVGKSSSVAFSWLAFCRRLEEEEKPDIVVVSGDIAWEDPKKELEEFRVFAEKLTAGEKAEERCLKKGHRSPDQRVLIVPGNHDVKWLNWKGDALSAFKKRFDVLPYPTVFNIRATSHPELDGCPIPESVVDFKELYGVAFHLLTSCYHAGMMPEPVKAALKKLRRSNMVKKLLGFVVHSLPETQKEIAKELDVYARVGIGTCPAPYRDRIEWAANNDKIGRHDRDIITFAVLHHPPCSVKGSPIGFEEDHGDQIWGLIEKLQYKAILCGHNHKFYESIPRVNGRPPVIPAGSLSGPTINQNNSFQIIDLHHCDKGRTFCVYNAQLIDTNWQSDKDWSPVHRNIWPRLV